MSTCENCTNKICLLPGKGYGKPCKEIEGQLKEQGIWSRDWIRPRVSPKRDSKENIGRWRELPSGLLRPGIDSDYAGDIKK